MDVDGFLCLILMKPSNFVRQESLRRFSSWEYLKLNLFISKEYAITLTVAGLEWIQNYSYRARLIRFNRSPQRLIQGWGRIGFRSATRGRTGSSFAPRNMVLMLKGFLPTLQLQMKSQMPTVMSTVRTPFNNAILR